MTPASHRRPCRSAFTLVELLAVIAIVGVLTAIIVGVVFSRARAAANLANCASNLRQCGQAMFLYAADHRQRLPDQQKDEVTFALDAATTDNWAASVKDYLGVETRKQYGSPLYCPAARIDSIDTTPICYAMNKSLVGLPLASLSHPGRTILLRHTNRTNSAFLVTKDIVYGPGGLGYADTDAGDCNYLFADGHVELRTPLLVGDAWTP